METARLISLNFLLFKHVGNLKKHFTSFVQPNHLTGREDSDRFALRYSFPYDKIEEIKFIDLLFSVSPSEQIETCRLPEQDYEMVKVSSISNPGLIFVRLDANSNRCVGGFTTIRRSRSFVSY